MSTPQYANVPGLEKFSHQKVDNIMRFIESFPDFTLMVTTIKQLQSKSDEEVNVYFSTLRSLCDLANKDEFATLTSNNVAEVLRLRLKIHNPLARTHLQNIILSPDELLQFLPLSEKDKCTKSLRLLVPRS